MSEWGVAGRGPFRAWLIAVLSVTLLPAGVAAQTEGPGWAVVPLLGFGVVRDGDWGSAGMEVAVEIERRQEHWAWSGYGSLRGLGVACSHACFDGGPALAVGGARSMGRLWVGGGVGTMRQFGAWHPLPYGRVSFEAASFRLDMRVELPRRAGPGLYVPLLIGFPMS